MPRTDKKNKNQKAVRTKKSRSNSDDLYSRKNKIYRNPDEYRAKIDNLDKINSSRFPDGFKTTILHEDPYIVKLRRFLNTEEIETLLNMAKGKFVRSTIVVDGELTYSDTRTSETAYITENGHYDKYSEPVERILKKACYLVGCERNQIEGLMVVKYRGNGEQYYMDHYDFFEPEDIEILSSNDQRICTFFCYLSSLNDNEGGETEFPLINVKVKPSKGTAVFWWNEKQNGELDRKTLHRGNPVLINGKIKYGLNIWIRSRGW